MGEKQVELTISLAQMDIALGDVDANLATAAGYVAEAARRSSDIVVLPELFTTGYDLRRARELAAPALDQGAAAQVAALARAHCIWIAASLLALDASGRPANTAAFWSPGGEPVGVYRKLHLFRPMDEHRYLAAGNAASTVGLPWGTSALAICYDLRFPELFRRYTLDGARLIFLPAGWPVPRIEHWQILCRARAIENQVVVAACNRVGSDAQNTFGGHSAVIGPGGEVLIEGSEAEALLTVRVDLSQADALRRTIPIFVDRRPELY
jgi:predicted amidohydrolase